MKKIYILIILCLFFVFSSHLNASENRIIKYSYNTVSLASTKLLKSNVPDMSESGRSFGGSSGNCASVLGNNGVKIVKGLINILRIGGAIFAIVNAMIKLIPAVVSKDAEGLKKASRTCVNMAIVLAIIGVFPSVVKLIGTIFDWDISCIL